MRNFAPLLNKDFLAENNVKITTYVDWIESTTIASRNSWSDRNLGFFWKYNFSLQLIGSSLQDPIMLDLGIESFHASVFIGYWSNKKSLKNPIWQGHRYLWYLWWRKNSGQNIWNTLKTVKTLSLLKKLRVCSTDFEFVYKIELDHSADFEFVYKTELV